MKIIKLPKRDMRRAYEMDKLYVTNHTFSEMKESYSKNPSLFVACYDSDKLIGLCWGSKKTKNEITIRGIAVEKKYWKRGIGKKLLAFFEKQVKKLGKTKITVGAANAPTNVVGFYAKSGYKVVKPRKDYTVMEKEI